MILYITWDGLLQPLGRSQVVRYVEHLARRGWDFAVLSMERAEDLADTRRLEAMEQHLSSLGVEWIRLPYSMGNGAAGAIQNVTSATYTALEWAATHQIEFTHARSYVSAGIAAILQMVLGIPYLFDTRGYWVDEKLAEGRWVTNRGAYTIARWMERALYQRAFGVISLAEPAAQDIVGGRFGAFTGPVAVIPTCVDDDEFTPGPPEPGTIPDDVITALDGRLVVGFIGSVNKSYRVDESCQLFQRILELDPRARLLCLTGTPDALRRTLAANGVPAEACIVRSVPHEEIAMWLRLVDWGLLLLHEPFAKRASMPTKLGEFFASGVRPVASGCNEDVLEWVRRSGTGIVLDTLTPESLDAAAQRIVGDGKLVPIADINNARAVTMQHFSLRSGVAKYDQMYRLIAGAR